MNTYILIFVLSMNGFQKDPIVSQAIEFNSFAACKAAADEIRRQVSKQSAHMPILLCAAKGAGK